MTHLKTLAVACVAFAASLPALAFADDVVHLSDVDIVYQAEPASYQPQGSDFDLADQGKSFAIECVIGKNGHMQDCQAVDNNMMDQNFVRVALKSIGKLVVGPTTRNGDTSAGKTLQVTCEFHRTDVEDVRGQDTGGREAVAASDSRDRLASNDDRRGIR